MDALPEQWIETALARARAEAAEVRPFIAVPSPPPAVCFILADDREEQQDDGHPVGTRWATMVNTFASTSTSSIAASGTSFSPSLAPIVMVTSAFQAALPQAEVGSYVSNGIIDGLKPVRYTERWILPNARAPRRPL